ncbi:mitochondrial 18 KDa protein-domain-containing protein [Clohesyomyces aquaticus]|uniref:Mitochondrial fission process protein 1 n=1 Tax=Clohesyomyces aquaticus TaxID=1231657 RepID=A0A1Y1Z7M7_9PLEO|nr:mitochondrial 18 KDa protein-domain-containing protein [Clohesyomyces aquaticus]
MAKDDKPDVDDIPRERAGNRPDFSTPPARKRLPKDLQATLDNEEKMWEVLYEGKAQESTDSNLRYAAYASRIRTIMMSAHRYVAYTSDIGESFRPIAHPFLVRGAYAVSWLYLTGDVSYEGYKAYLRNQRVLHPELRLGAKEPATDNSTQASLSSTVEKLKLGAGITVKDETGVTGGITGGAVVPGRVPAIEDYRAVMAQRAVFQAVASMGLPAFTIHSIVRYSGRAMKDMKNKTLRTYGPIGLGLAAVPFLPFIFDEPVEKATEWIFHQGFKAFGGEDAVAGRPVTGNKDLRYKESREGANKEKEL